MMSSDNKAMWNAFGVTKKDVQKENVIESTN